MSGADEVRNPCESISPRMSGRPGQVAARIRGESPRERPGGLGRQLDRRRGRGQPQQRRQVALRRGRLPRHRRTHGERGQDLGTGQIERPARLRDPPGVHALFRHDDHRPAEQLVADQVRHRLLAERVHRGQLRLQVRQVLLEIPYMLRQLVGLAVQVLDEAGVDDRRPHHHAQPESEEDRHDRDQVIPPGDHTSSFRRKNHSRTCSNARSKKSRTDGEMAATTMSIVSRAEPISRKVSRARSRELP